MAIEEFTETLKKKRSPYDVSQLKKDAETDELKSRVSILLAWIIYITRSLNIISYSYIAYLGFKSWTELILVSKVVKRVMSVLIKNRVEK